MYDLKESGKRIAKLRNDKGLTQAELAEELNINAKTISKVERGVIGFSVDNLIRLSEYFNVELEYLVGHSEQTEQKEVVFLFKHCPDDRKELLLRVMKEFASVQKGA